VETFEIVLINLDKFPLAGEMLGFGTKNLIESGSAGQKDLYTRNVAFFVVGDAIPFHKPTSETHFTISVKLPLQDYS
jgi:hypothetical protein